MIAHPPLKQTPAIKFLTPEIAKRFTSRIMPHDGYAPFIVELGN
jgi:hypothetical protein